MILMAMYDNMYTRRQVTSIKFDTFRRRLYIARRQSPHHMWIKKKRSIQSLITVQSIWLDLHAPKWSIIRTSHYGYYCSKSKLKVYLDRKLLCRSEDIEALILCFVSYFLFRWVAEWSTMLYTISRCVYLCLLLLTNWSGRTGERYWGHMSPNLTCASIIQIR